jgi:hypothetical protein
MVILCFQLFMIVMVFMFFDPCHDGLIVISNPLLVIIVLLCFLLIVVMGLLWF